MYFQTSHPKRWSEINPAFITSIKEAVRRLGKDVLMEAFILRKGYGGTKLVKKIKRRPALPAYAERVEELKPAFLWENTYTVWYLRKRLFAALVHHLVHRMLLQRFEFAKYVADEQGVDYDFHEGPTEAQLRRLAFTQSDIMVPEIEGHPAFVPDPSFMKDWEWWAPPKHKFGADWTKYLPQSLATFSLSQLEVSREVPEEYKEFV